MVRARAAELSAIGGRSPNGATMSDLAQAKRELTGEPDIDPKEAVLESAPEALNVGIRCPARPDTKFQSPPAKTRTTRVRSDNERLVEEGIAGAEQMTKCSKPA